VNGVLHGGYVRVAACSVDGRTLVVYGSPSGEASEPTSVALRVSAAGSVEWAVTLRARAALRASWVGLAPGGDLVVLRLRGPSRYVALRLPSGEPAWELPVAANTGADHQDIAAVVSPDGAWIAVDLAAGGERQIRIHSMKDGRQVAAAPVPGRWRDDLVPDRTSVWAVDSSRLFTSEPGRVVAVERDGACSTVQDLSTLDLPLCPKVSPRYIMSPTGDVCAVDTLWQAEEEGDTQDMVALLAGPVEGNAGADGAALVGGPWAGSGAQWAADGNSLFFRRPRLGEGPGGDIRVRDLWVCRRPEWSLRLVRQSVASYRAFDGGVVVVQRDATDKCWELNWLNTRPDVAALGEVLTRLTPH